MLPTPPLSACTGSRPWPNAALPLPRNFPCSHPTTLHHSPPPAQPGPTAEDHIKTDLPTNPQPPTSNLVRCRHGNNPYCLVLTAATGYYPLPRYPATAPRVPRVPPTTPPHCLVLTAALGLTPPTPPCPAGLHGAWWPTILTGFRQGSDPAFGHWLPPCSHPAHRTLSSTAVTHFVPCTPQMCTGIAPALRLPPPCPAGLRSAAPCSTRGPATRGWHPAKEGWEQHTRQAKQITRQLQ